MSWKYAGWYKHTPIPPPKVTAPRVPKKKANSNAFLQQMYQQYYAPTPTQQSLLPLSIADWYGYGEKKPPTTRPCDVFRRQVEGQITQLVRAMDAQTGHKAYGSFYCEGNVILAKIECGKCSRRWRRQWSHQAFEVIAEGTVEHKMEWFRGFVRFWREVSKISCYTLKEQAELAEWLTHRAVAPAAWTDIERELQAQNLADAEIAREVAKDMELLEDGVRLRLPPEHPLC